MSGGAGKRQKTTKEYRSQERKLKRELKAVQKKLSKSKSKSRRDDSKQSDESASDSDSDCWLESTSKHGGDEEEDLNKTKSQFTDSNKNKALIKTQSNDRTNVFESIVSKDVGSKNLVDDLSGEQRASSVKAAAKIKNKRRPTPVTLAHVWGSKKNRKIKYDNLRVLIDTGCSDSLALFKYGRNKK